MKRRTRIDTLPLFAMPRDPTGSYATDGRCHNAEPGGFESGYCRECREHGHEARRVVEWRAARLI